MKINILLYHLKLGGVEKSAVELANELASLNHDVTITTIYNHNKSIFKINKNVKTKKTLGFYFNGLDRIAQKLKSKVLYKLIIKEKYDVEIAFQASLPTTIISKSNDQSSKKYAWIHGIGATISEDYKIFDKIVFVGQAIRDHYLDQLSTAGIALQKTEVVYNPLNVNQIIADSKKSNSLITYSESFNLVSVGRLSKEKNFDRLIDATKILLDRGYRVHTYLVGEGQERPNIEVKISQLNLNETVTLTGFQSNPYKFIKNSDCYVCTSDYEGFNIAISEAAILGKSIVSTNVYGAKELLGDNNEYGIVCGLTDMEVADSIESIIKNNELRVNYESKIKNRIEDIIASRFDLIKKLFPN